MADHKTRNLSALFMILVLAIPLNYVALDEAIVGNASPGEVLATISAGPPVPYDYRDFGEIEASIYAAESEYPDIVKVHDIGDSWETTQGIADRNILAVKVSDNVDVDEDEPEVLIMALHHAREWPTSEIAMQLIENLTDLYGHDDRVSWLVDNREVWIIPVVNPDGLEFAMTDDDMWRKNRRDNGDGTFGVDLNRNYAGAMNGDPLGDWGGAGTSNDTSSDVYCGEAPFSEPETQAIRDLTLSHDFQTAIDFHTYDDSVMWPWGYTANLTPDDDDFVRIGNELAALNGYDAEQSVSLYPTTGDSLDWLYGGADVYAFLFEVGKNGFHPEEEDVVLDLISVNIPPALHLIEVAGDREDRPFAIDHEPLADSSFSDAGFAVAANITAGRGVDPSTARVMYRVDGGSWAEAPMSKSDGNDTYGATIPSCPGGSAVEYYITARDVAAVEKTAPAYAPYDVYSFTVLPDEEPPMADAGDDAEVPVGHLFEFNGSGSTDNVAIVNYTWSFEYDGELVEIYGESPTYTFWVEGTYVVTLNVSDGSGNHAEDSVTVTASNEAIPEFGDIVVPVVALLAVFFVVMHRRRVRRPEP